MARHLFLELQEFEKAAQAQPMEGNIAPPQATESAGQPPTVPPENAGIPEPQQQKVGWIGPQVGAFPTRRMLVNQNDPNEVMSAAISALISEYNYLQQYPMEPRIIRVEGNVTIGEILVALPQNKTISIPFVVNDGILEPPIALFVDKDYYAIPPTETGFARLVGRFPTLGVPAEKGSDMTKLASAELADYYDPSQKLAILAEFSKYPSFLDEIAGTPFGKRISDLLAVPEAVVQYERVPYGVIEKVAYMGKFAPIKRELRFQDVPKEVLDQLESGRRAVTLVYDINKPLEKTAASTVTVYTTDELKPGMGIKARYGNATFPMRILEMIPWEDTKSESNDIRLMAVSSKGTVKYITDYAPAEQSWVAAEPPKLVVKDVTEMWKYPGKKMAIVAGKNAVYAPVLIGKNRVFLGTDYTEAAEVEISDAVVRPKLLGKTLFLPKSAKAIFLFGEGYDLETSLAKVASKAEENYKVHIKRLPSGFNLSGLPVERAEWDGAPLESQTLSFNDAVFVLGALGVKEGRAISKVASAEKKPQGIAVDGYLISKGPDILIDLGFMKLAAAIPEYQDELLALQMMGSETLQKFIANIPSLYGLADDLAKLTLAAQIGLDPIDPETAYVATKNVLRIADQLTQLKDTTSGVV